MIRQGDCVRIGTVGEAVGVARKIRDKSAVTVGMSRNLRIRKCGTNRDAAVSRRKTLDWKCSRTSRLEMATEPLTGLITALCTSTSFAEVKWRLSSYQPRQSPED